MASIKENIELLKKELPKIKEDVLTIASVESVKHFKQSFKDGGFTDGSLEKWKEVERRKPKSGWYGFQLGTNGKHPTRKRKRGSKAKSNFSPRATKRGILLGSGSSTLRDSIRQIKRTKTFVKIGSEIDYADVHNFGLNAKIFGKQTFKMPKREFVGESKKLNKNISKKIERIVKKVSNKLNKKT